MIERIAAGIVCAVLVAGILEVARRVRGPRAAGAGGSAPSAGKTIVRLILSVVVGFFLGAITAGILEEAGVAEIAFESVGAAFLIAFWTALVWLFLSRRDWRRAAQP